MSISIIFGIHSQTSVVCHTRYTLHDGSGIAVVANTVQTLATDVGGGDLLALSSVLDALRWEGKDWGLKFSANCDSNVLRVFLFGGGLAKYPWRVGCTVCFEPGDLLKEKSKGNDQQIVRNLGTSRADKKFSHYSSKFEVQGYYSTGNVDLSRRECHAACSTLFLRPLPVPAAARCLSHNCSEIG